MPNGVFVLDKNEKPLMPCHPARARKLLKKGRAVVVRMEPFTILIKDRTLEESEVQPIELKLDPGSRTTGIALVGEKESPFDKFRAPKRSVIWAANLEHRGWLVKKRLDKRRMIRRSRRHRKTRYRKARFMNRRRPKGWLPPSLQSRVLNVSHWAHKLLNLAPLTSIEVETARFDTQKMQNPEISGTQYQQGTLAGYESREYLLSKWGRQCAYCGATDVRLQLEHIVPRAKGGSDRISNLTLACEPCNKKKGSQDIGVFLSHDPTRLQKILSSAKKPLRDAAAMNAIRYVIGELLTELGLPIRFWTGGRTKYNRVRQKYCKKHWIDAACVGITGEQVSIRITQPLLIKAVGRGNRQMCKMDKYGFPRTRKDKKTSQRVPAKARGSKRVKGFQTGDYVRAVVPSGKYKGTHIGRVIIRASGSFDIKTKSGKVGANWKYCQLLQRDDGYEYSHLPSPKKTGPLGKCP